MRKISILYLYQITVYLFLLFKKQTATKNVTFFLESFNETQLTKQISNQVINSTKLSAKRITDHSGKVNNTLFDDIIELNVGGQRITTYRSTLTVVAKSKLAMMFAKTNQTKESLIKDKDETVFFDYNPIHFNYLLDQLRDIKRQPNLPFYEMNILPPTDDISGNFSHMISELGLNVDRYLSPLDGVRLDLNINSLIGWKECYRDTYDKPFDLLTFVLACKGRRLLIGCRPAYSKQRITLAGVGNFQEMFQSCSSTTCHLLIQNETARFYYSENQAWGFVGRPKTTIVSSNPSSIQVTTYLNPCDSTDEYAEYRLCWSLRSNVSRGGGDRCGKMKNLHNADNWERIIYQVA